MDARLVVSDTRSMGPPTEAGTFAHHQEGKSCLWIAGYLNRLGIPPAYVRDGRKVLRGNGRQATSGLWTAGRIRSMIVNTTYRGVHQFGKRSGRKNETTSNAAVPTVPQMRHCVLLLSCPSRR
jgi:site-specific DNA recombinase